MATPTASRIFRSVQGDLIVLAILEARVRQGQQAVKNIRQRIATRMSGGVKVTPKDLQRFVREHNRRCARTSGGISIPTWLVKQRNGVKAVRG